VAPRISKRFRTYDHNEPSADASDEGSAAENERDDMAGEARPDEESETLRRSFRAWLQDHLPNDWRDAHRRSNDLDYVVEIRRAWGRELYEGGWAAPHWPIEYGGMGLSFEGVIAYTEELARVQAPESLNSNAMGILAPTMIKYASSSLKQRYLGPMVAHDEIWCQGFSEPGSGSDLASLQMRAERVSGGFRITGQKIWTSRAQYADNCYMLVRTDPTGASKYDGITMAIVDMHQPEIEVRPIRNMTGSSEFNEVFVDGAFFPDENVVGDVGQGWEITRFALSNERGPMLVERAFNMKDEFDELTTALQNKRLSTDHAARFVSLAIEVKAVRAALRRVLDELAAGSNDTALLASVGKLSWSETHQHVVDFAVDVLGADAVQLDSPDHRWLQASLASRAETIWGGTSEIQRNLIARLVGMPSASSKTRNLK
jgi:alkylation response protein AidB-like acyl-CoA dehydrogenase